MRIHIWAKLVPEGLVLGTRYPNDGSGYGLTDGDGFGDGYDGSAGDGHYWQRGDIASGGDGGDGKDPDYL